jgi:hypothetical protein
VKILEMSTSRDVALQQKKQNPVAQPASAPVAFTGRHYQNLGIHENDPNYGRPVAGSRTEFRGKQAGVHISGEIVELCSVIHALGKPLPDGTTGVHFGPLFETYTRISNKLVGMLIRARKQGLVDFEGEMLFQQRDDHVLIRLLKTPDDLAAEVESQRMDLASHPSK